MPYSVVTGASQGIGKANAEKLLQNGYELTVCARTAEKLETARNEWMQLYPEAKITVVAADLATKEGVKRLADAVAANAHAPDLLVNNAGTYQPGQLATEPEGQLEMMMDTNLYSAYRLTRLLLPQMLAKGAGHIVNMCSVASLKAYPNGGAYSISKYALLGFTENLREEVRQAGIRVTAICPGATWSPSWTGAGFPEERLMKASDVADILWAAHALSPQAMPETIILRPQLGDL